MVNRKEISGKGYVYVITRRIVQRKNETVLRVRVKAYRGSFPGEGKKTVPQLLAKRGDMVMNDFKDYKILAEGDAAFGRIVKQAQGHCWS